MSIMSKAAPDAFTLSARPAEQNTRMVEAGIETWLAATGTYQREMAQFVANRLEKDKKTLRAILESRDWARTAEIQTRWAEEAFRDYCLQATRMIAVCSNFAGSVSGKR